MLDFFMHDFNDEKWKKAALKNAFILMGKQRFQHAAAFFLLAGSIKDAIQVRVFVTIIFSVVIFVHFLLFLMLLFIGCIEKTSRSATCYSNGTHM